MKNITRKTHTIDATGQSVGRLASRIAALLMGKGVRTYDRAIDGGDYVTVANVRGVKIGAAKLIQKKYKHFSGYPGGLKETSWGTLMEKNPQKLLRLAVLRMLPKNRLQQHMIKRLTIE